MKKIGLLIVLLISLTSCSNDDNNNKPTKAYHGKWNLTVMDRIKSPFANYIIVLEWEESYIFNSNGSFSKTRIMDNKTSTISGFYSVVETSDKTHFTLLYGASNEMIASCTGNLIENLYITNSTGRLYNTWETCDGPLLIYDKSK